MTDWTLVEVLYVNASLHIIGGGWTPDGDIGLIASIVSRLHSKISQKRNSAVLTVYEWKAGCCCDSSQTYASTNSELASKLTKFQNFVGEAKYHRYRISMNIELSQLCANLRTKQGNTILT